MTRRSLPTSLRIIVLLLIATGLCGGCGGKSGYASFLAISPDGRYVAYEDRIYLDTYLYDTVRDEKTLVDGSIVYIDEAFSVIVVRQVTLKHEARCSLLIPNPEGPVLMELPPLALTDPPGEAYRGPFAQMRLLKEGSQMLALVYDKNY